VFTNNLALSITQMVRVGNVKHYQMQSCSWNCCFSFTGTYFFLSGTVLTITRNALTGKFECRCGRSYSSSHSLLRHKTGCHNTVNAEELRTDETNIEDMQIDSGDETFESVQASENQVNCLSFYHSLVLEQFVDSNFFYV
jgi:hypothetical protein